MNKPLIPNQKLSIKLFGEIRQILNRDYLAMEIDTKITVSKLRKKILENYSNMKISEIPFIVAVNYEFAKEEREINLSDEIALIPPVSGG